MHLNREPCPASPRQFETRNSVGSRLSGGWKMVTWGQQVYRVYWLRRVREMRWLSSLRIYGTGMCVCVCTSPLLLHRVTLFSARGTCSRPPINGHRLRRPNASISIVSRSDAKTEFQWFDLVSVDWWIGGLSMYVCSTKFRVFELIVIVQNYFIQKISSYILKDYKFVSFFDLLNTV